MKKKYFYFSKPHPNLLFFLINSEKNKNSTWENLILNVFEYEFFSNSI